MKKRAFRLHPLTIFYLMRSYWLVFIAPPIRITLQYITEGNAQVVLLSEIIAIVTVLLLAVLGWIFTKITAIDDKLIIRKGFLIKSCNVISFSRTYGIYTKRNLTDIIFKSADLYIKSETDGSDKKSYKIKVSIRDLDNIFDKNRAITIRPVKSGRNMGRFFVVPMAIGAIILVGSLTIFQNVGFLQIALLMSIDVYYVGICYHNYIKGRICIKENIIAVGSRGLSICELCCAKDKIGIIKIWQTPADRILKTCKIKITGRGAGAEGIKINNTCLKNTISIINKSFNLKINV